MNAVERVGIPLPGTPLTAAEVDLLKMPGLIDEAIALGSELGLANDVLQSVRRFGTPQEVSRCAVATAGLFELDQWNDAVAALTWAIDDPSGMGLLACFLRASCLTRRRYVAAGIPDTVFLSTMSFFPRFIERYRSVHGIVRFDQEFWAPRLVAMSIFRIGELEFELVDTPARHVGVHIPSDARLDEASLTSTLQRCEEFLHVHCPGFDRVPLRCESWLLDPALEPMLAGRSRIRVLRSLFVVQGLQYGDDYKRWICGRADVSDADLPEDTSLQRAIKRFVLAGGRMGVGYGVMPREVLHRLGVLDTSVVDDADVNGGGR